MRRGDGPSARLTFRLDPPVRERLKWAAEIRGVAESVLVREALQAHFKVEQKPDARDDELVV